MRKPQKRIIDENEFWNIINSAKANSKSIHERATLITHELVQLSAKAIKDFSKIFADKMNRAYTWDIWAVAYIANEGIQQPQNSNRSG